jgi:hypothetical protein
MHSLLRSEWIILGVAQNVLALNIFNTVRLKIKAKIMPDWKDDCSRERERESERSCFLLVCSLDYAADASNWKTFPGGICS